MALALLSGNAGNSHPRKAASMTSSVLAENDCVRSRWLSFRLLARAAACAAVIAGVLPDSAAAVPVIHYNLQPFGVYDTTYGLDSLPLTTATLTTATGSGTAAVRVTHGEVGAYAEAIGGFGVLATVVFEDTLTVTSSTLPDGTPVDLAIFLAVDYMLSGSGLFTGGGNLSAFLGLGNQQSGQATTHLTTSSFGPTDYQSSAILHTFVGATVGLTAQLNVGAAAGNAWESGYGLGDALHTMRFFVDPTGPLAGAFSYTSETGAPYFTPAGPTDPAPVPEPASFLLVAMGLGAVVAHRRGRR
jgi:hypothetical protein